MSINLYCFEAYGSTTSCCGTADEKIRYDTCFCGPALSKIFNFQRSLVFQCVFASWCFTSRRVLEASLKLSGYSRKKNQKSRSKLMH